MSQDEIQVWMLIAFIIALFFSFYKVYLMFNKPAKGKATKVQYTELEDIITKFLKNLKNIPEDEKSIFDELIKEKIFLHVDYHNFNLNRFKQILQQIYFTYDVDTLSELIKKIK